MSLPLAALDLFEGPSCEARVREWSDAVVQLAQSGLPLNRLERAALLGAAARHGQVHVARALVDAAVDERERADALAAPCVTGKTHEWTPLAVAVDAGHVHVAEVLLDAGASIGALEVASVHRLMRTVYRSPLSMAVVRDAPSMVQALLKTGQHVEVGAMRVAAQSGSVGVVRLLLDAGPEMDETVVLAAVRAGRCDVVRLLVERDAPGLANEHGTTLLVAATMQKDPDSEAMVRVLLEAGVDPRGRARDRRTPLANAALLGLVSTTELLLAHGADCNAMNPTRWTPLTYACEKSHVSIVRLLLEHGADPNLPRHGDLRTRPLLRAVKDSGSDMTITHMLLAHGADANYPHAFSTPLTYAARQGSPDLLRVLANSGCDLDIIMTCRLTALGVAAISNRAGAASILLEAGASVDAADSAMPTPLAAATTSGHVGVVRVLLQHGANAFARSPDGETPLDIARKRGHGEIEQLLRWWCVVNPIRLMLLGSRVGGPNGEPNSLTRAVSTGLFEPNVFRLVKAYLDE